MTQPTSNGRIPGSANANAQAEAEMRQIQAQEQAEKISIWDMVAEDARRGNVKDPKKRNVKGRADKLDVASRVEKTNDAREENRAGLATKRSEGDARVQEAGVHEQGASKAIASASDALGGLKQLLDKKNQLIDERSLV